jgi:hypothetical protein
LNILSVLIANLVFILLQMPIYASPLSSFKLKATDCPICHVSEAIWLSTDVHGHAFERLKADQKGDLRCVGCHRSSENHSNTSQSLKNQALNQEEQRLQWLNLLRTRSKIFLQNMQKTQSLEKKQNLIENMLSYALKEQNFKQSDIGCQDCHGIGKIDPSAKIDESIHQGLKTIQSRICERCHTIDQSRLIPFRFEDALLKIKHTPKQDQE